MSQNSNPMALPPIAIKRFGTSTHHQRAGTAHNRFAVGLETGNLDGFRADRDDELFCGVAFVADFDGVFVGEDSLAFQQVDFVALEQHLHAAGHLGDDAAFPLFDLFDVHFGLAEINSVFLGVFGLAQVLGDVEQGFGVGMQPTFRHTPPTYSRSTQAVFSPSWAARMAAW